MTVVAAREARRVEHVMGTAFGITTNDDVDGDIDSDGDGDSVDAAFAWLRWVDRTFSAYRDDSEISRLGRGLVAIDEVSAEVREVLVRCDELTDLTDGWFATRPSRPGPTRLDPSGLVKGWSIDRAALLLRMAGHESFAINGGGDILCGAPARQPRGWRVGIRHPSQPDAVAAVLTVESGAVATSGTYERGDHLWGRSGPNGGALASVTVVGPDLGTADALATAVFVEGSGAPPWFDRFVGYDRLVITTTGRVRWTSGLDDRLVHNSS